MNHLHTPDSSLSGPDPQIPQPEPLRPAPNPPSARRLRANRANARNSRGPITPEGKARSSHNSVKHALLTETILLAPEDREEFHNLARSFCKEFQPPTAAARVLIDDFVAIHWRRLRIRNLETELLNSAIEKQQAGQPFRTRHAALAFKDLADNSNSLHLLNRYEARFNREFNRTLRLYLQLHQPDKLDDQTNPIPLPDADDLANPVDAAAPAASSATERSEGCASREEVRGEGAPLPPNPGPLPPNPSFIPPGPIGDADLLI